mmetsp:Transcript_85286/g.227449  ORF Transcript_85286/g.227449 Transcript_85286/m.227449 type:complete len:110 (+) Transcript_85286:66-395(+)
MANDTQEMLRLTRKRAGLEEIANFYNIWKTSNMHLDDAKTMFAEAADDPELREMAREEIKTLEEEIGRLESQLKVLLLPKVTSFDPIFLVFCPSRMVYPVFRTPTTNIT